MEEIRTRILKIFNEMFPAEKIITDDTKSGDIHAWDSLNHIILINKVEEAFAIKFELDEILTMQSFGELCQGVKEKLGN